jgi:hypothetical protein
VHTGDCLCSHDDACEEGEECNAAGHCQPLPGCFDNGDCAEGYFCDTPSRTCIPEGTCTTKFQCPIGQICTDSECVDGCEDHGDCPFKQPCIQGECVQGVCEDESFCDFLELCEDGSCMDATQAPYCKPCKKTNLLVCGDRLNPCLVYPYRDDPYDLAYPYFRNDDGSSNYCGTNCSQDQPCPNGFECRPIVTIKPATDFCQTDADCPGGLPCLKSAEEDEGYCPCHDVKNRCAENFCLGGDICQDGKCVLGSSEDAPVPCTQDSDCNLCMLTKEHCLIDGDCREIPCVVDPESGVDYGSCVVTMACGLMEGLHCPAP